MGQRDQALSPEQRAPQSEDIFRMLVEGVRDYAIFLLDPTGNVTVCSYPSGSDTSSPAQTCTAAVILGLGWRATRKITVTTRSPASIPHFPSRIWSTTLEVRFSGFTLSVRESA